MDARLPLHPNLGFYRKTAKDLKRAVSQRDEKAAARFVTHHPKFRTNAPSDVFDESIALSDALLVIAREHGFSSWAEFRTGVERAAATSEPAPSDRLLAAVRAGDQQTVRQLIAQYPGVAASRDSKGALPLVEAADRGLIDIATVLLDAGADPRLGDPLLAAAHPGPHKRTPALDIVDLLTARGVPRDIFFHALLGRVDAMRDELKSVDVNARGPADSSALFLAVWNGQVEGVRLLLDAGADPNLVGRNGQTPWQVAFLHAWSKPHREAARLLLDRGARCTIHEACTLSHVATVTRLLAESPALANQANEKGLTPLGIAIRSADVELARVLLDAGADDPKGRGRALVSAEPQQRRNLARTVFRDCSFDTAHFHDCNLKHATLSNINLSDAIFDNVNLSGATIDNASIKGLKIYGIDVEPLLVKELEKRSAKKT
jgi:ankyrin repeat protein